MQNPTSASPISFGARVRAFSDGTDTPRAFLERCIETIEVLEPTIRAFVVTNVEGARRAADDATSRYKAKRPLSLVDGVPLAVKDLYETEDMPTQMGSPIFQDRTTNRDAASVYALRSGGAVILGKAVTTEFGFYSPGPTRNPRDVSRTPGGSSSGSAAAVAANMIPLAIASQVVGSLIRPASYCGVHGYKPTLGAINRQGGHSGLSQAVIGMHANTLQDTWIASVRVAEIVGGDPGATPLRGDAVMPTARKPACLVRLKTAGWSEADPEAKESLEQALRTLEKAGVRTVSAEDDPLVTQLEDAILHARAVSEAICGYELKWPLLYYRSKFGTLLSDDLTNRLERWAQLDPEAYGDALARREVMRRCLAALEGLCDAFVTLSAPGAAPIGLSSTGNPDFAVISSILGVPAISLPLLTSSGLPLGLQLVGFRHHDRRLMGTGAWVESMLRSSPV